MPSIIMCCPITSLEFGPTAPFLSYLTLSAPTDLTAAKGGKIKERDLALGGQAIRHQYEKPQLPTGTLLSAWR